MEFDALAQFRPPAARRAGDELRNGEELSSAPMANAGTQIRAGNIPDVDTIRDLVISAYAVHVRSIGRDPAPMVADYATLVQRGHVWVAVGAGGLIDGVLVMHREGESLSIDSIAVRPALQGQGVGTALMTFAERMACDLNLADVRLYTNQKMTANIDWYRRLGYQEISKHRQDGYDRVFFRKPIGS